MYWMVGGELSVGRHRIPDQKLILDSGSSLLVVPQPHFQIILTHLLPPRSGCESMSGVLLCPCDVNVKPLVIKFTGMDGSIIAVKLGYEQLFEKFDEMGSTVCRLGMMLGSDTMPSIILGDVFLREV